ncbi:MAG: cytochrome-c peroxidase [Bacteroidetes bacterium]|nr:cytochrome-c peroxidase [Bacteroidota bacterium]
MRAAVILTVISGMVLLLLSFMEKEQTIEKDDLREIYSRPTASWPAPHVSPSVSWKELGLLPESPIAHSDSLQPMIELGKILFFDTKLSGSGKISCASCHDPALNWTDGKKTSVGHEGAVSKRNSPTIQNTWYYNRLFWDGRSRNLQDQAFGPINSETEMHSEMYEVMRKLSRSSAYRQMFKKAFGDEGIDPDRLTEAIAVFEKTIISRKSRFDEFLEGNKKALSNSELRGLHLFRTKARCINCHNGPLFSDNLFHNVGFSGAEQGYYKVSHNEADMGKIKTPSLRDVTRTGPWMHDGQFNDLQQVISRYNLAKFPPGVADTLLRPLGLSVREKRDLLAFLGAISAPPVEFNKPAIPE